MPDRSGELLAAALSYAARGWRVLPVRGKKPRITRWTTEASSDPATIHDWWTRWPTSNVGVLTGEASGLVVVDVDPRNHGDESVAALEAAYGALTSTLTAETSNGGRHYYYRHPGVPLAAKLAEGVDLQGDGCQVVAPPSLHPSGFRYRWVDETAEVAELPGWIVDKARRVKPRATAHVASRADGGAASELPPPEPFPELIPEGVRSALWTPVTRGRYRYVYRGAMAAARAGWTRGQYVACVYDSPMVAWVDEHGEQALARHVENAYRKVADQGTFLDDVRAHVLSANAAADLWVGRDGRRRRRVLWNFQSRAWDMGGGTFRASLLDLEEVGPESKSVLQRTRGGLVELGWVSVVSPGAGPEWLTPDGQGVATEYRLVIPTGRRIEGHDRDRASQSLGYVPSYAAWELMRHPATRREALGVKADTLQLLTLHGPLAVEQLAALTGLAPRTVRDHLALLGPGGVRGGRHRDGWGLVHEQGGGRWTTVDGWLGMLDGIAEATGATHARRKQQHAAEVRRQLYRDYLADRHAPVGGCRCGCGCGVALYVAGVDRCQDCSRCEADTVGHGPGPLVVAAPF